MRSTPASVRALAVAFPKAVRRNDHWLKHHPRFIAALQDRAVNGVWTPPADNTLQGPFLKAMAPYLADPFRGTVERRVLGHNETTLSLELKAARRVLSAAKLVPQDIDITLCASFLGDHVGVGNGAFLAGELGLQGPAWNVETACAGSLASLHLAAGLIGSGQASTVLVVVSCSYSRVAEETDPVALTCGDGAAAFIVAAVPQHYGILGSKLIHTAPTCGSMYYELHKPVDAPPRIRMRNAPSAAKVIRDTSEDTLLTCCKGALEEAGVAQSDVKHFVFNTPTAWFIDFACAALAIDRKKTVNAYPQYANVGPVLLPANLHAMARQERLKRGDLVLFFSVGSVSSAGATVLRCHDLALDPAID